MAKKHIEDQGKAAAEAGLLREACPYEGDLADLWLASYDKALPPEAS